MTMFWIYLVAAAVIGVVLLILSRYASLWLQAYATNTRIGLLSLVLMSLRKVDPRVIVRVRVMAVQAGLTGVSTNAVEAQYLAGGDVYRIMLALIAANRAGIDLDWNTAAAIDLAGRDILEAVQISVSPQVIACPVPEAGASDTLDGVAKDGIQLKVRALVTVRTNLSQLIGGAKELTVVARVGQGIVAAIGACDSYQEVLADPTLITRQVIARGLDAQTSFAIDSIDIASIEVGENIGANLQQNQANADMRIARASAEKRRSMAVACEQEMVALERKNQALVVLAEAQIAPAIAAAFLAGRIRMNRLKEHANTLKPEPSRFTSRDRRMVTATTEPQSGRGQPARDIEGGEYEPIRRS